MQGYKCILLVIFTIMYFSFLTSLVERTSGKVYSEVIPLLLLAPPFKWVCFRSQSEPHFGRNVEGFRESPDLFHTYHGYRPLPEETTRSDSPPPGFIDEPSTPLPLDIGGKVSSYSVMYVCVCMCMLMVELMRHS